MEDGKFNYQTKLAWKIMDILERDSNFRNNVYFLGNFGSKENGYYRVQHINAALVRATEDEKIMLFENLLYAWINERETCSSGLFPKLSLKQEFPLIATLTGNRNQLRIWLERPGGIGQEHCDSCGDQYLFQVSNPLSTKLPIRKEYIDITGRFVAPPIELPNGGLVFARGNEENRPKMWVDERYHPCRRGEIKYPERYL